MTSETRKKEGEEEGTFAERAEHDRDILILFENAWKEREKSKINPFIEREKGKESIRVCA